jgi:hypothetical protein
MYAINAIYDGTKILTEEPITVKGRYEIVIAFTKPLDNQNANEILKYSGTWDDEDLNSALSVVNERKNFSMSRYDIP